MNDPLEAARAELRRRQGAGARYDAATAPARTLAWARQGTAFFARLLNGLDDGDLDAPSAIPGVARRQLVAHVGYHARALSGIVAWARGGAAGPMPGRAAVDPDDVSRKASQPARALRHLFAHSAIHLDVEWRDLEAPQWERAVEDAAGRRIALADTPWLRARALWRHGLDLRAGGRIADAPPGLAETLARDRPSPSPALLDL